MKKKLIALLIFGLVIFLVSGCISLEGAPKEKNEGQQNEIKNQEKQEQINQTMENKSWQSEEKKEENATQTENNVSAIEEEIKKTKKKEISYTTKDKWVIYGDIYYAKTKDPKKAIVLLHQLGSNRSEYEQLIPTLQEAFPDYDIVALDMRGHGKSTNLGKYQNFIAGDFRAMKNDLIGLKSYLSVARPSIEGFYIVGSSIGSSVALDYAATVGGTTKVVMISPGLAYHDLDITEDAKEYMYGLYIATAEKDTYSFQSAQEIYRLSPSDSKAMKVYYDLDAHGLALIEKTKNEEESLSKLIVRWLGN